MRNRKLWPAAGAILLAGALLAGCVPPVEPQIALRPTGEADTTPPVIRGVRDLTVYRGDPVAYLSGITAADDTDPAPVLTVDASQADLTAPGTYPVTYTATDAAGNRTEAAATLTVLEKPAGAVPMEQINSAADRVLAWIIHEDDTPEEQVRAIYEWARGTLRYGGHSDRTDWRQTAYTMLTQGTGDCYGYFSVTKLLFQRLGIPNIDVEKVKNDDADSNHYWSLVSIDGGQSYYHFDATPRVGDGDDFCLVTDAFLDAYSAANRNSHNRDRARYPATPEEAP